MMRDRAFLHLLQLASPALPIGAYNYSEGLETLIEWGNLDNGDKLCSWLEQELRSGSIRLEGASIVRVCQSYPQIVPLNRWNAWLSAVRETEELRQQSWQMGQSLKQLLTNLEPELEPILRDISPPYNYAIIFGIAVTFWQIEPKLALLAYLQTWLHNLISSGVKLIPLGQTTGQKILIKLYPLLLEIVTNILIMEDEDLGSCSWGLALASMGHEVQYTRLFRS